MANDRSGLDRRAFSRGLGARTVGALWLAVLPFVLTGCTSPTFVGDEADGEVEEGDDAGGVTRVRDAATAIVGLGDPDPDEGDLDAGRALSDGGAPPQPRGDAGAPDGGTQGGDDAGTIAMSALDAGPIATGLPDWARPLIGTYAKRSVAFSWDDQPTGSDPYNTRNVEYSIVNITQNGSALELSVQLCDYSISLRDPDYPPLTFKNASATSPVRGRILLGAPNTFSSTELVQHLGFDPMRTACEAGKHDTYSGQSWISGSSCVCSATQLPVSLDECRVTDGDGDGRAGITARGPGVLTSGLQDYLLVFEYAVTMLDGQVGADGAHTLREKRAQGAACIARDGCDVGHNTLCPGGTTKLMKHTDYAALTCASLNKGNFGPLDDWPSVVDCRAK